MPPILTVAEGENEYMQELSIFISYILALFKTPNNPIIYPPELNGSLAPANFAFLKECLPPKRVALKPEAELPTGFKELPAKSRSLSIKKKTEEELKEELLALIRLEKKIHWLEE